MIIRYAFFEGEIHHGQEQAFRDFVKQRLVPLWTKFPGADEVRVMLDSNTKVYARRLVVDNAHDLAVLAI